MYLREQRVRQPASCAGAKRIALFGGTFDPPHRGHVAVAKAAADAFGLLQVLFAPVGRQPLKLDRSVATYAERLAMVELTCREDARFAASELDGPRADGAPNYTVDTLLHLRRMMPEAAVYNLVGADSFLGMPKWHEPERLLEMAEWIVVSRPGFPTGRLEEMPLSEEQRSRVHLLETVQVDLSATELRRRLERGESCADEMPGGVAEYIAEHGLYRSR